MENPIRVFLDERGLTTIEFARIAGTHGVTAAQLMVGYHLNVPKKLKRALELLGGDADALSTAYQEWRDLSKEKAVV